MSSCLRTSASTKLGWWILILGLVLSDTATAGPHDSSFSAPKLQTLGPAFGSRVALQADGKILVHGQGFSAIGGIATGPLARFNSEGTLDSSFAFSRDYSSAFAVAPMTNGQIVVNAALASFAGDSERLLRINADGTLDNSFNTGSGADGNIRVITLQPDGKVLVGGLFTTFNRSPYPGLVRLNTDGSIDPTFGPVTFADNTNSTIQPSTGIWTPIILQPDGKVIVGGVFSAVNGIPRDGLARLNPNGTVDTTLAPSGFSVLGARPVRGLGFQSEGMLIVGGRLALGTNSMRRPLVRLNTNGVADPAFVTSFSGPGSAVRDLKIMADDRIVAVDDQVYRFNADGTKDSGFVPDLLTDKDGANNSGLVSTAALQSDGKVVFAGLFSFVGSQRRDGVARLNPDGSLDSFDVGRLRLDSFPKKVFVQTDGKVLMTGDYSEANGAARSGLARFDRNGALDEGFDPAATLITNTTSASFVTAALQPDDRIFVVSSERNLPGASLARLNPDGTLDGNFNAIVLDEFGDAFALPDGKLLLLADNNIELLATAGRLIWRLNIDGSLDSSFQLDYSFVQAVMDTNTLRITAVYAPGPKPLLSLPGGKLLVASLTTNLQFKLVRLNKDGSIDTGFTAGVIPGAMQFSSLLEFIVGPIIGDFYQTRVITAEHLGFFDAASQADGKLIVVGQFTHYNGSAHNGIVRLNSDGSIDSTFDPGAGPQWVRTIQMSTNLFPRVESVTLVGGEKIFIAGNFEAFSGAPLNGLARLNADGSVDTNFYAGLERGNFGLFPRSPARLIPQPDGNFLLAGQFRRTGQSAMQTLARLLMRPSLTIATPGPGGPPQLSLTGGADLTYFLQTSTNLDNWMTLTNVTATNDVNSFVDSPVLPRRYYRAMSLP